MPFYFTPRSAHAEMRYRTARGQLCAVVPALTNDGEPIAWITACDAKSLPITDRRSALVAAIAITMRAYKDAHKNGVRTVN